MGYDDFEGGGGGGGVTLFPYYDLGGGAWKISNENYIEHMGGPNHFSPQKEKEMKICCWTLL